MSKLEFTAISRLCQKANEASELRDRIVGNLNSLEADFIDLKKELRSARDTQVLVEMDSPDLGGEVNYSLEQARKVLSQKFGMSNERTLANHLRDEAKKLSLLADELDDIEGDL